LGSSILARCARFGGSGRFRCGGRIVAGDGTPEAIAAGSMRCQRPPAHRPYFLCGLRPGRPLPAAGRQPSPRWRPFGLKRCWRSTRGIAGATGGLQFVLKGCRFRRRRAAGRAGSSERCPRTGSGHRGAGVPIFSAAPIRDPFVSSPLLFLLHADSVPCSPLVQGACQYFSFPCRHGDRARRRI